MHERNAEHAARFRTLHTQGVLRLANAWDAGSARLIESLGAPAYKLRVGDRVYLRHAKAGELCERFDSLFLIEGDRIVDEVATYRGEGRAFL